jgi:uncharacterized delta-60 repeat protein
MRGSVIVTFDEEINGRGGSYFDVFVNNIIKNRHFTDITNLYAADINIGNTLRICFENSIQSNLINYNVYRRDYTTDDTNGNNGIINTLITGSTLTTTGTTICTPTITATTSSDAYDFEYRVNVFNSPFMFTNGGFSGSTSPLPSISGKTFDIEILNDEYSTILVGHMYQTYQTTNVNTLTPLFGSGIRSTLFSTSGISSNTQIYDIKQQLDGKILVTGLQPSGFNIKRLNINGTIDTSFNEILFSGSTSLNEERIELQSDGKIIFGNDFQAINSGYTGLMRFNSNGTLDTTFNLGGIQFSGSVSNQVKDVYVYNDNKILIAGYFNYYNGYKCNSLIRLNSDGSVDTSFILDTTGNTSPFFIQDIEVLSNGKILVGCFLNPTYEYFGYTVGALFRLNSDGSFDTTFPYNQISAGNTTLYPDLGNGIEDIYEMNDNTILIGGAFTGYSGNAVTSIIKLNSDGTLNGTFNPPLINGAVTDIEVYVDGNIICGGNMTQIGSTTSRGIIKLHADDGSSLII